MALFALRPIAVAVVSLALMSPNASAGPGASRENEPKNLFQEKEASSEAVALSFWICTKAFREKVPSITKPDLLRVCACVTDVKLAEGRMATSAETEQCVTWSKQETSTSVFLRSPFSVAGLPWTGFQVTGEVFKCRDLPSEKQRGLRHALSYCGCTVDAARAKRKKTLIDGMKSVTPAERRFCRDHARGEWDGAQQPR